MTVRELRRALEGRDDDQYIYVRLHRDNPAHYPAWFPDKVQLIIQNVVGTRPWYDTPDGKELIGLDVHENNKELP